MCRVEGKIFVVGAATPETLFNVEQHLNNELASRIYKEFGVSIRVHLSTIQEEGKRQ